MNEIELGLGRLSLVLLDDAGYLTAVVDRRGGAEGWTIVRFDQAHPAVPVRECAGAGFRVGRAIMLQADNRG